MSSTLYQFRLSQYHFRNFLAGRFLKNRLFQQMGIPVLLLLALSTNKLDMHNNMVTRFCYYTLQICIRCKTPSNLHQLPDLLFQEDIRYMDDHPNRFYRYLEDILHTFRFLYMILCCMDRLHQVYIYRRYQTRDSVEGPHHLRQILHLQK